MIELKKCPFCGGEAQVNTWTMHGITESRCFCSNSDCPNSVRTVALEQWNSRPIEDALNARIAELEAENAGLKERVAMLDVTAVFKSLGEMGYIEQTNKLHARIAELEAAQRWIPVSERLPFGEKVLVLWKDRTIHLDWTFLDGGGYYWWNSGQSNVTHWMPLPQPPEVQE
jgi:hypothetical protein